MVAFRNVVAGTAFENFISYGDNQISFSRGNKGKQLFGIVLFRYCVIVRRIYDYQEKTTIIKTALKPRQEKDTTTLLADQARWFWQDCVPATTGSTHTCTGN